MTAWLVVLLVTGPHVTGGPATVYWPKDGYCGAVRADDKPFTPHDNHVAHRRLPLGTAGFVCSSRTGHCAWTAVRDRGPWGAIRPCGQLAAEGRKLRWKGQCYRWQAQTRLRQGWAYRGAFDLTRPVADAIGHRAFDVVTFYYWPVPRRVAPACI